LCAHIDSTGKVLDGYVYGLALDGTWGGVYVSPTTGFQYDMDGFLVKSRSGFSKALALLPSTQSLDNQKVAEAQLRTSAISAKSVIAADQRGAFEAAIAEIRNVLIGTR